MIKRADALFYGQALRKVSVAWRIWRFMEKALTGGWKALIGTGIASLVGAGSLSAFSVHPQETKVFSWFLAAFGIVLVPLGIYGFTALIFPSIAPPPQMLQDRLFWTAKRYRTFLVKNGGVTDESFRRKFWRKYPFKGLDTLAKRAGINGATVNWELLTTLPTESVEAW